MSDTEPNGPRFHLVDVFATERYAGNQLAVVESRGRLADDEMAAVAAEFDFSETTFVESLDPDPTVRIFTPEGEIQFAGHPTLGTAAVVRSLTGASGTTTLDLGVGPVPVRPRGDALWMTQAEPTFGPEPEPSRLAAVLGLPDDAVTGAPRVVSTGLPTVVVPLADRTALTDVAVDRPAYDAVVDEYGAKNVLAFCHDPRDPANDLAARVFAPAHGVPEDPATGSSNGCLAAYLARRDGEVAAWVEQGYEMGRPSRLGIEADADGVTVRVGGRVVPVGRGRLHGADQGI